MGGASKIQPSWGVGRGTPSSFHYGLFNYKNCEKKYEKSES